MGVTLRNVSMAMRDLVSATVACRLASAAAFLSACFFNADVMLEDIAVMLFCTVCSKVTVSRMSATVRFKSPVCSESKVVSREVV